MPAPTQAARAATLYTLIETARRSGLDPAAYLHDILTVIADQPINRVGDLLPWNYPVKG